MANRAGTPMTVQVEGPTAAAACDHVESGSPVDRPFNFPKEVWHLYFSYAKFPVF